MTLQIRELQSRDEEALRGFFDSLTGDDRTFFKEDLDTPDVLRRWIDDERGVRLIGTADNGSLVAIAAVWPGVGQSGHVGDFRLVVAADHRRLGLGREMWKLTVEVVSDQQGTIDMFLALGFTPEAVLRDQLRTADGNTQDVMLLSHFADEAGQDVAFAMPDGAAA
jgi:GNAT superfamily N-acetyltransferase